MKRTLRILMVLLAVIAVSSALAGVQGGVPAGKSRALQALRLSGLRFEPNVGQAGPSTNFVAQGLGYKLALNSVEARLALGTQGSNGATREAWLSILLLNANTKAKAEGKEPLPSVTNYYIGNNPAQWRSGVKNYSRVLYRNVYPGIDLTYYGNGRELEYDFVLSPGADPSRIRMNFAGMQNLRIDQNGDLVVTLGGSELVQHRPVVYQQIGGSRKPVNGSFRLVAKNQVAFQLAAYDRSKALTIDPSLAYSGFLGDSSSDIAAGIAVDANQNIYIAGQSNSLNLFWAAVKATTASGVLTGITESLKTGVQNAPFMPYLDNDARNDPAYVYLLNNFPTLTTGNTSNGNNTSNDASGKGATAVDGFVAKFTPDGSALVFVTFLGGRLADQATSVAVDATGNVWVGGYTKSCCSPDSGQNFPGADTTLSGNHFYNLSQIGTRIPNGGGGQGFTTGVSVINGNTVNGDNFDGFIAELNSVGNLLFSTYVGGTGNDQINSIAVDGAGNVYAAGYTASVDLPVTTGASQAQNGGGQDGMLVKIVPGKTGFAYLTYLGGSATETINGIAVDAAGNAYVAGTVTLDAYGFSDFPYTCCGAYLHPATGVAGTPKSTQVMAAKFDPSGNKVYANYWGGSANSAGNAIAVDATGNAYIAVQTTSADYPVTAGVAQKTLAGGMDAAVTKIDKTGMKFVYSTFLGGSLDDAANGIAVDKSGNAYIAGTTTSSDFPFITAKGPQTVKGGGTGYNFVQYNPVTAAWTTSQGTPIAASVSQIVPDGAGNYFAITNLGLYKSADGVNFAPIGTGIIGPITAVAVAPSSTSTVYAGTAGFVFQSIDGGQTFTQTSQQALATTLFSAKTTVIPKILSLAVDPQNPAHLLLGTDNGMFASGNGGASFNDISKGINIAPDGKNPTNNAAVYAVAFNPAYSTTIYAATDNGLQRSTDGGNSWPLTSATGKQTGVVADKTDPTRVFITNGNNIQYSFDGGKNFSQWLDPGCTVGTATFLGQFVAGKLAGLNDATFTGSCSFLRPGGLSVQISAAGTPDQFQWQQGAGALSSPIAITGNPQLVGGNVYVQFKATTGHTVGTSWTVPITATGFGKDAVTGNLTSKTVGNKGVNSISLDYSTTPPTVYASAKDNGAYVGAIGLDPIYQTTPVVTFAQLGTTGLNCTKNAACLVPVSAGTVAAAGVFIGASSSTGDGFVAQLDPNGAKVPFATYYGGSAVDSLKAITVDAAGNFYAAGSSQSSDLSVSSKAWQSTYNKSDDAVVVKYSAK